MQIAWPPNIFYAYSDNVCWGVRIPINGDGAGTRTRAPGTENQVPISQYQAPRTKYLIPSTLVPNDGTRRLEPSTLIQSV